MPKYEFNVIATICEKVVVNAKTAEEAEEKAEAEMERRIKAEEVDVQVDVNPA